MADRKLVTGRREVERKYLDRDGKECSVMEMQPFSEYVPLSADDLKQRAIDDAAARLQAMQPAPKTSDEIIKELTARIDALEAARAK